MRRSSAALVPAFCFTWPVARSMTTSDASPSATAAVRWVPSGLTADDMILPSLMTVRLPYGLMYWSLEMTCPLAVSWATCWVPKCHVEATAAPVTPSATAMPAVTSMARRPTRLPKRSIRSFCSTRRCRVTCMDYPFEVVSSRSTLPSNCQSGLGASPVEVRSRK